MSFWGRCGWWTPTQCNFHLGHVLWLREKNELIIPDFQRPLVWTTDQKIKFLESVALGLPIGVYCLHEDEAGYTLIDGQQRFSAIYGFVDGEFEVFGSSYKDFSLKEQRRFGTFTVFPALMLRGLSLDQQKEAYDRMAYMGTPHDPALNPFKEAAS